MTDQLSRAFQALADPTRRDLVARLAADGDASVGDLAAPYDVSRAGGLQAPQGARGGRAGEPEPGRAAPAGPPRGGGAGPDDRSGSSATGGRPRSGSAGSTPCSPPWTRPATQTREREQHHERHENQTQIEAVPDLPVIRIDPRVRGAAGAGVPGLRRPRAVRAVVRPAQHRHHDRRVGRPDRRGVALHGQPGERRLLDGLLGLLPRGPASRSGSCRPSPSRASPTA